MKESRPIHPAEKGQRSNKGSALFTRLSRYLRRDDDSQ